MLYYLFLSIVINMNAFCVVSVCLLLESRHSTSMLLESTAQICKKQLVIFKIICTCYQRVMGNLRPLDNKVCWMIWRLAPNLCMLRNINVIFIQSFCRDL